METERPGGQPLKKRVRRSVAERSFLATAAKLHGDGFIMETFDIRRTSLSRWKSEIERLREQPSHKYSVRNGAPVFPAIEEHIISFIEEKRALGCPIDLRTIKESAITFRNSGECPDPERRAMISTGWVWNVLHRNRFSSRVVTHSGRKVGFDENVMREFHVLTKQICAGIPPDSVLNMDKVSVIYEQVPRKTFAKRGSSTVPVVTGGKEKYTITVALTVTASGRWLDAYAVLRRKTVPKHISSPGVQISANETAWMTTAEFVKYFDTIVAPYTRAHPSKCVLLLDSARSHTSTGSVAHMEGNVSVSFIPRRHTAVLQPLDLTVMKPFRSALRPQWLARILEEKADEPNGEIKPPTHQMVLHWVPNACTSISRQTIVKGWRRAGFEYLVPEVQVDGGEGCEDDLLPIPENYLELAVDALNSVQITAGDDDEVTD